jgi:glycogen synthase
MDYKNNFSLLSWYIGIVNGIDINDWNPTTDKCLPYHYSVDDLSGKVYG